MKPSRGKPFIWRIVSPLVWPFVLLYAMGVRLKTSAYDFRLFKARHLSWPVISVGNLSVGGTGKTPVVLLLAKLLEARGWGVDVLSRGYGRSSQHIVRVDPQGQAEQFGDEPLLMSRHGVSTCVGADRYQAGLLAEKETRTEIDPANGHRLHLLDDGFQHRKLARAIDIVLLQRADLEDDMLPAGRLREPLCALERADICVLRAENADLKERVLQLMRQTDPARIWIVERQTTLPSLTHPIQKALAFCAIGDPHGFFHGLQQAGIDIEKKIAFRDHHVYTLKDISRLRDAALSSGAQCFVTTEKDNVRLTANLRAELEKDLPLIVAGLAVSLREEVRSMATLESLLAASKATPLQV